MLSNVKSSSASGYSWVGACNALFESLDEGGIVYTDSLLNKFNPKSYPLSVVRGRPPAESENDFLAAVDYLASNEGNQ